MRTCAAVWACLVLGVVFVGAAGAASTYLIPNDTSIGTWDAKSRTYTLTTDVVGSIHIWSEDDLTLDGAGHTVTVTESFLRAVVVVDSSGVTVRDVTVQGPGCGGPNTGIHFADSDSCTAVDNVITDCAWGIALIDTPSCTITGNDLSYCGYTVHVFESDACTLTGNTISDAWWYGLWLTDSSDALAYNNNFVANGWQHAVVDSGTGNVFSLPWPIGGNYWSGWTGPDVDGDGIVDSPYTFSGGQDDLPWTTPDGWLAFDPGEQVGGLADWVADLGLPAGIDSSLMAKLDLAMARLDDNNERNDGAAVNALGAFINQVEAQSGKKIDAADADDLIAAAQGIIIILGG